MNSQLEPQGMDCVVVGGPANGALLKGMRLDASFVELSRPEYIKPLESAFQNNPDIAKEKAVYEVHPVGLTDSDGSAHVFGIAVVEGETLSWAFSQLVIGFVESVTQQLLADGLIDKQ